MAQDLAFINSFYIYYHYIFCNWLCQQLFRIFQIHGGKKYIFKYISKTKRPFIH